MVYNIKSFLKVKECCSNVGASPVSGSGLVMQHGDECERGAGIRYKTKLVWIHTLEHQGFEFSVNNKPLGDLDSVDVKDMGLRSLLKSSIDAPLGTGWTSASFHIRGTLDSRNDSHPRIPGGGGTLIYWLYGYVPLERVWFSNHLVWYRVY